MGRDCRYNPERRQSYSCWMGPSRKTTVSNSRPSASRRCSTIAILRAPSPIVRRDSKKTSLADRDLPNRCGQRVICLGAPVAEQCDVIEQWIGPPALHKRNRAGHRLIDIALIRQRRSDRADIEIRRPVLLDRLRSTVRFHCCRRNRNSLHYTAFPGWTSPSRKPAAESSSKAACWNTRFSSVGERRDRFVVRQTIPSRICSHSIAIDNTLNPLSIRFILRSANCDGRVTPVKNSQLTDCK